MADSNKDASVDEVQSKDPDDVQAPLATDLQDPALATEDQRVNDEGASVEGVVDKEDAESYTLLDPAEDLDDEEYHARTSDSDDVNRSWTVQSVEEDDKSITGDSKGKNAGTPVPYVSPENAPGQVFFKSQLPDPAVVKAAGIDYGQLVSGLPVADSK